MKKATSLRGHCQSRTTNFNAPIAAEQSREGAECYSVIAGGVGNSIDATSCYSAVAGGYSNSITSSSYQSFVGGGSSNAITNSACYSVIAGGSGSSIYSPFSAILGGQNNVISSGFCYVGIFGCGINTVTNCTFHANCMVVQNIPISGLGGIPPGSSITGTLYYVNLGPGHCQVYVA